MFGRAAKTCQHVAADKIQKFPCLFEYFADVSGSRMAGFRVFWHISF